MRRLVMATVVLTALAGIAQAGGPPKAIRLVDRMKMYDNTHYIRGSHGKNSGGSTSSSTAEARQEPKAPETPKPGQKQTPPPQKAD